MNKRQRATANDKTDDDQTTVEAPLAVMISYKVETDDQKILDYWGESWGPPQLVLLSDMKLYAPLLLAMARAIDWNCFLDVSRDSSFDDDQPEDDTAVPTYHEHDARNSENVLDTLQGEVSALRLNNNFFMG